MEAMAITMVNPRANGNELKHFKEIFRKTRRRKPKSRDRPSQSSRRNKRKADLTECEQWGQEMDTHAKQLDVAHVSNILKQHSTYTARNTTANSIKSDLSLTFQEMYRNEQIRHGESGPIFLYQLSTAMLFLKGLSDHKVCNKISVAAMLLHI